ncbi:MAG: hypothetical protein IT204_19030 [Fimbriimonadaceae bacterium]|nr:hypothetical protein [Fimbriimonadaceae bacterium]
MLAKRLIAQRCLYGVDKNPMAVDLAKLSLWLATLAKDHPFTFVDHSLRAGDSLVGLTRRQILGFHWRPTGDRVFGQQDLEAHIDQAVLCRRRVLDGGDHLSPAEKSRWLAVADGKLDVVRLYGDLVIAAFFGGSKDKERQARRDALLEAVLAALETGDVRHLPTAARDELRAGSGHSPLTIHHSPVSPFHWEIEFPEVFGGERAGFDGIVGNPPFAGHVTVTTSNGPGFTDYLRAMNPESGGKCDLVAFFFRRAFELLRPNGCFGLIATNTIGQGDTRSSGLRWTCGHGGTIYAAQKRYRWPGQAAVVVSVVHLAKRKVTGPFQLNGRSVPIITAYLFHAGGHDDPARLRANTAKSFQGSVVRGMGFTFDDTDTKQVASPLAVMADLVSRDPRNAERIFPYLGGEEVNDSPTHSHHRYIINFGEMTEPEARKWPELFQIVESRVLPARASSSAASSSGAIVEQFWQFGHTAKELYGAIEGMARVLANSQVSSHVAFAILPTGGVFGHTLNCFVVPPCGGLALLQCRVHEAWARFFGSSLEERFRYTPSDCFETFPFPRNWESNPALESIGQTYYDFRADLMVCHNEGLTKTYNRFHDPDERNPDLLRLRELHAEMDRAVLDAYGWSDLPTACEFLLEYEDEEDEANGEQGTANGGGDDGSPFAAPRSPRRRRKPWRYRWPDAVRDEVLARLLALNAERAEEERLAGLAAGGNRGSTTKRGGRGKRQEDGGLLAE